MTNEEQKQTDNETHENDAAPPVEETSETEHLITVINVSSYAS